MPRVKSDEPATLFVHGKAIACRIIDLSSSGLGLELSAALGENFLQSMNGENIEIQTHNGAIGRDIRLPGEVRSVVQRENGNFHLGLQLDLDELKHKSELVSLVYGDSERWVKERADRMPDLPVKKTLKILFRSGILATKGHVVQLWKDFWERKKAPA